MSVVVSVENVSKLYRLGQIGGGMLREDLSRMWAKMRGHADPTLKIGEENHARKMGEKFWALENINFEVKEGEVYGIIGRNGAGKSTLLKILSQVTNPTSGHIKIKGRIASLLEVGTGFHPDLTGRENTFLNGAILGMTKAEIRNKFDEIVAFSGIEEFIDTPVKRYSSGMYVRLAFAVAAHLEPEILVIDEVLAVGDAEFQKKCLGKMNQVAKAGRTVLFVSHSLSTVVQLCNQAIMLKDGKVFAEGGVEHVAGIYFSGAEVSSDGEFDLTANQARSDASNAIIRKVRLCKANGVSSSQMVPDEPCCVEIDYETNKTVRLPRWAIAIEDCVGRRIMTFASYFQDGEPPTVSGSGKIRCLTGPLGLGPGKYLLSVSLAEKTAGMLDSVDNAAWFEVIWNNNFKDKEPYSSVYGPVLRKSEWKSITK